MSDCDVPAMANRPTMEEYLGDKPKVCGNCKHASDSFKIGNTTHVQCHLPKNQPEDNNPYDTLREWYNRYECFEPKEDD